jgi:hypothetical protein
MGTEKGDAVAAVTVVDMTGGYKEEGSLPTGVSAEPEGQAGALKEPTKAKGKAKPSEGDAPSRGQSQRRRR